ncbi:MULTISPECIES: hypothetical protein [Chryseobacterium]|uniref:Cthe-2314-like HEPN domain-containing protein n=1 Tax=Chryseobacterium nepalense TaxID=1854498 RepID=A0ABY4KDU7_9FLAO|nr:MULTISPECIES: hypothetical protein [Chryseobacterium]MEA1849099.1 hypothetical protein [Chryseobacterium sp. MHB01]UPQ77560.1 hypothetical protein M0D58_08495 [Chryseobacterium nepalense]
MRNNVIEKISYFYQDRIDFIYKILETFAKIEFDLEMSSISLTKSEGIMEDGILKINLSDSNHYNVKIIFNEILEDFFCSLDLLKTAYFKQSLQVVRNILELCTMQLYFTHNIEETSNWKYGKRGIEKIFKMTGKLKNQVNSDMKSTLLEIDKFYNLLNRSTHSHKLNLNIYSIHKFDIMGTYGFEYKAFQNSYLIILCCLKIFLKIYESYIFILDEGFFKQNIKNTLEEIKEKLQIFEDDIENYKKGDYENGEGYLIYRKHMVINGKQYLYSFSASNQIIWNSKKKGLNKDFKKIYAEIDKYLIRKIKCS